MVAGSPGSAWRWPATGAARPGSPAPDEPFDIQLTRPFNLARDGRHDRARPVRDLAGAAAGAEGARRAHGLRGQRRRVGELAPRQRRLSTSGVIGAQLSPAGRASAGSTSVPPTRSARSSRKRLDLCRSKGFDGVAVRQCRRLRPPHRLPADRQGPARLQPLAGGRGARARPRRRASMNTLELVPELVERFRLRAQRVLLRRAGPASALLPFREADKPAYRDRVHQRAAQDGRLLRRGGRPRPAAGLQDQVPERQGPPPLPVTPAQSAGSRRSKPRATQEDFRRIRRASPSGARPARWRTAPCARGISAASPPLISLSTQEPPGASASAGELEHASRPALPRAAGRPRAGRWRGPPCRSARRRRDRPAARRSCRLHVGIEEVALEQLDAGDRLAPAARSTATTRQPRLAAYWLQLPGAAPRSSTRAPRRRRPKRSSSSCSLKTERARQPSLPRPLHVGIVELPLEPALRGQRCGRARSCSRVLSGRSAGHASASAPQQRLAQRLAQQRVQDALAQAAVGDLQPLDRPAAMHRVEDGAAGDDEIGPVRAPMQGCAARSASSSSRSSRDTAWITANGSEMPSTLRRS